MPRNVFFFVPNTKYIFNINDFDAVLHIISDFGEDIILLGLKNGDTRFNFCPANRFKKYFKIELNYFN